MVITFRMTLLLDELWNTCCCGGVGVEAAAVKTACGRGGGCTKSGGGEGEETEAAAGTGVFTREGVVVTPPESLPLKKGLETKDE